MKQLQKTATRPYHIIVTTDFNKLKESICEVVKPSSIMVITDTHVGPLYLEEVCKQLETIAPVFSHQFEAGEQSKYLGTITKIYDKLIECEMDRSSLIVALGGGVVGDMSGFVASSYMRGIPFVQIPTTIVAQNDSSIGGKVGVDYLKHKNMVGAFYQPVLVYTNLSTLRTLPEREMISGLAEVLKHAFIKNKALYDYLNDKKDKILEQDLVALEEMTYYSCLVKCSVVEEDTKELGLRKILNFGHTLGHALETVSDFTILHGECVAYGIVAASFISYKRGLCTQETLENVTNLCKSYHLLQPVMPFDIKEVLHHVLFDKKKAYGKVAFILINDIGAVEIVKDVTEDEMQQSLIYIQETCQ
ncbi:3-dehydroquinate synthase [Niameybacter massiliensis]|uniref:3-dehydroquinate synthase n=1 Tax=Holtiella tumoricola TaxID=3018743 RepID=A0AA42DP88_9FIRM|nr:3-dehydroquinate synthase [Holtiella tumoricola]MDA3732565.1 3-dehydroquinate synthase [Holtiella tumoricola]